MSFYEWQMILSLLYGVLLSFEPLIITHLFDFKALIQFLRSNKTFTYSEARIYFI